MKKIVFTAFFAAFLFCLGCDSAPKELKEEIAINEMRVQVGNYMADYQEGGNAESLEKALQVNHELITKYGDKDGFDSNVRIQILFSAGRKKEAFALMGEVISDDPKNPERLMYNGLVHKMKGETELAGQHFEEAVAELDKSIEQDPQDIAAITMKITVYINAGEKEKAWKMVEEKHNANPEDAYWVYLSNNFEEINARVSELYEGINID